MCRNDHPATRWAPHNGAAGQPPRQIAPVHLSRRPRRPPARDQRGRRPSIHLRATTLIRDAGAPGRPASQKAGAPGRHATRNLPRIPARPTISRTRDPNRCETDGRAGRPPPQYGPEGRCSWTPGNAGSVPGPAHRFNRLSAGADPGGLRSHGLESASPTSKSSPSSRTSEIHRCPVSVKWPPGRQLKSS